MIFFSSILLWYQVVFFPIFYRQILVDSFVIFFTQAYEHKLVKLITYNNHPKWENNSIQPYLECLHHRSYHKDL